MENINVGNLLIYNLFNVTQHILLIIKNICGHVQYKSEYYEPSIVT